MLPEGSEFTLRSANGGETRNQRVAAQPSPFQLKVRRCQWRGGWPAGARRGLVVRWDDGPSERALVPPARIVASDSNARTSGVLEPSNEGAMVSTRESVGVSHRVCPDSPVDWAPSFSDNLDWH